MWFSLSRSKKTLVYSFTDVKMSWKFKGKQFCIGTIILEFGKLRKMNLLAAASKLLAAMRSSLLVVANYFQWLMPNSA